MQLNKDVKIDWDDISLIPDVISNINSRSEIDPFINNKLPLFVAPMDMVVNSKNAENFYENGINVCLPRSIKYDDLLNKNYFYSYGLDEIIDIVKNNGFLPNKVLIDVANGHMKKLLDIARIIKKERNIELMAGNIANPKTYREYCEIGIDYIRVGIGGGSVCTTSANVSIHYPMASLIMECNNISKEYDNPTKIVADGGFKNYADIIKAIALGAHYVMLGSIFNKAIESAGNNYLYQNEKYSSINEQQAIELFNLGENIYKYYRGMSTKEVQKHWNKKELKTSEGITKYNKVEYTITSWVENFTDYIKSAMSYCGAKNLNEFRGEAEWVIISQHAFNRFNK
jgi:IMP dehydrogenase/GMP reductase